MVSTVDQGMERVDAFQGLVDRHRPEAGQGLNILLIGSDSREGITEEERQRYRIGGEPCYCADTIIVLHLSADRKRASVVSLPRDSYAELPAHTVGGPGGERHPAHPDKMNAALSHGGPPLMVRTVEKMTGVRIDHYLEVSFLSFMRGVDELGGVDVCSVRPLRDEKSGLDLPPGTSTLSGGEALQYVRARSLDPSADIGRMQRQQRFLASVVDKAVSAEVLLNPDRLRRTAGAMLDSVRVDPDFGVEEVIELGKAMHAVRTSGTEFTSVPIHSMGRELPDGGSTIAWDTKAAERLFRALREDRPLTVHKESGAGKKRPDPSAQAVPVDIAPEEVEVRVENASSRKGLAAAVEKSLSATGFSTLGVRGDDGPDGTVQSRTTITHDPDHPEAAAALRTAVPGAQLRAVADHGSELLLSVGEDFTEVRRVRDAQQPMRADEFKSGGYAATTADQVLCD
jgi:LCP family protein required for cell wall assembly